MARALGRTAVFAKGTARVDVVAAKVVASRVSGHIDGAMMRALLARFDEWRAAGGDELMSFHDLEGVTDYDSEARLLLTTWLRLHRSQFRAAHVLVRSQALTWGMRLIGTLTDGLIVAHSDRRSFETAVSSYARAASSGAAPAIHPTNDAPAGTARSIRARLPR